MRIKICDQLIVAMSGSFDVILNNGMRKSKFHLNRSYYGLYVPSDDLARNGQFFIRLRLSWFWLPNFYDES